MKILPASVLPPTPRLNAPVGPQSEGLQNGDQVSLSGNHESLGGELGRLGANRAQRQELHSLVECLSQGKSFPAQSYLIQGDSGTGTTTTAEALLQDLGRFGVSAVVTSGGELLQKGPSGVSEAFKQARQLAGSGPAVLFIDDVDSAFPPRQNSVSEETVKNHQALGVFLDEASRLQDPESGTQILLVATTSRSDAMDWNARDRFQRSLTLGIPANASERKDVVNYLLDQKGLLVDSQASLSELAEGTRASNPLKLSRILDRAVTLSNPSVVTQSALRLARLEESYGPVNSASVPEWAFRLTAGHELGHAVIRRFFEAMARPDEVPLGIDLISLIPRQSTAAAVELKYNGNPTKTLEYYVAEIASNYGGRAAEQIFGDGHISAGAGSDLEFISRSAREAVMEKGLGATTGSIQPGPSGLEDSLRSRAEGDIERLTKTCEHLALTITRYYGPLIQEMVDEFAANRHNPARLVVSGQEFAERMQKWEQAVPERAEHIQKLRRYVREKMEGLRPPAGEAWDPVTGTLVPIGKSPTP